MLIGVYGCKPYAKRKRKRAVREFKLHLERRLFSVYHVYVSNSLLKFIEKYTYFAKFIISVLFVVIIKLSNLFMVGQLQ